MGETAFVQARMSSSRVPGKMLIRLNGKPLLAYVLERLDQCESLDQVVLATSGEASDDPLAEFAARQGNIVFRGPLQDVAGRFLAAMEHFGLESCVRINGDSPFINQRLVDRAVGLFEEGGADLVTNVFPRSFPKGQSVEVFSRDAMARAHAAMDQDDHREHVTKFFYDNHADFRIRNFSSPRDYSGEQLTIDSPEDLDWCEALLATLEKPHWAYGFETLLAKKAGVMAGLPKAGPALA